MIVRINQIDPATSEAAAGWPPGIHLGGFRGGWPAGTKAYELEILAQDEQNQPLPDGFRQHQLRHLIPQVAIALRESGQVAVLRLDGPIAERELLPVWRHLTDPDGRGRYAFASAAKLDDAPADVSGSIRLAPLPRRLAAICNDPAVGLERMTRCRVLMAADNQVATLLDAADAEDPRWEQLLPNTPLAISTTVGLKSLHIFSQKLDLAQTRQRVMQRLMAVARGEPAIP